MEDSRFDAWTRRRFGAVAAGGGIATVLQLAARQDGAAKKKCRKVGKRCKPGGRRNCCGNLRCDSVGSGESKKKRCCRRSGDSCTQDRDCCAFHCCSFDGVCSNVCVSDRTLKANFGSVDPADMVQRVRDLPISTWNYTSDDPAVRHIGPMAQDFVAAFGVGADDRYIHPIDGQGVALAAIQGLAAEIAALREENARLAARIAALE